MPTADKHIHYFDEGPIEDTSPTYCCPAPEEEDEQDDGEAGWGIAFGVGIVVGVLFVHPVSHLIQWVVCQ